MKKLLTFFGIVFCLNINAQIISTVAGGGNCGNPFYCGDGGQATDAVLYAPYGVACDAAGNLYIADNGNSVVRKINTAGIITTIAGTGTTHGYSGDGGQATAAKLFALVSLGLDAIGNLYIADYGNNRIRKVNTLGIITTIVGNGTVGNSGDGGYSTAAQLSSPTGIAFDTIGNLFVADAGNNRIRMINSAGIISTIAGNGSLGGFSGDGGQATAAKLNYPSNIAFDKAGNMYITDMSNYRIRKVNTAGIITTIAGTGIQGYSGDGGNATAAELNFPYSIAVDGLDNLFIADDGNNAIRKINPAGIINTIAGNGVRGFSGDGGQATNAELYEPSGVAFDRAGNLFIADEINYRVRKIELALCEGCASIEQITNTTDISIYPNPNNSSFIIEPSNTTKQTIQVYDVSGKLVLSQTINGKTNIDASILSEGVYNVSLINSEGVVNKRLVIVK